MHISVQSNVEPGKSVYFELYVSIVRGEFDDQLKWPFDGEITVQAYNRTLERWDKEVKMCLNKDVCELTVVQQQIGILSSAGWGYQAWLSSQDMKLYFMKDTNVLRLRVVSVKVNSV
jgi:TNF receptor-associated factor 4